MPVHGARKRPTRRSRWAWAGAGAAGVGIARLLGRYRWIAFVGLAIILYVALDMIWRGFEELGPAIQAAGIAG